MNETVLQLGAVAVIFAFAIKEFFAWLRTKKNGNGKNGFFNEEILRELQTTNTNHLHGIQTSIEEGNRHLIDTIHNDNVRIVELLAEIKGAIK